MKVSVIGIINSLIFFCVFTTATNSFAATLMVTQISDTADGVCDADCSLREAVTAAADDDTIVFSPLFNSPQTIALSGGQIIITKSLTIAGSGANLLTVIGNNTNRIFHISNNVVVTLSGMKLTGGRVDTLSENSGGAIYLTDGNLTLTNMTLSGNLARFTSQQPPTSFGFGGAVYSYNSTLSVINSTINNNTAPSGGGIHSSIGIVNIINSTVSNNSGGGIRGQGAGNLGHTLINVAGSTFNDNSGIAVSASTGRIFVLSSIITNNNGGVSGGDSQSILTVDRSVISNNEEIGFAGASGVGIRNSGTATISNTTISNNRASGAGSGIYNTGTMSIVSSAILNNRASESGGGVFNAIGQLFLTNSTVSGNIVDGGFGIRHGGGIHNTSTSGGSMILTNSTITNNYATGFGGGLRHDSNGTVTIRNTIIAGNLSLGSVVDASGIMISQGFNLIGNTTDNAGWIASDLLNQNPHLAPLGNNGGLTLTHALMQNSPAINAGNNVLAKDPTTNLGLNRDQRGYSRISGVGTSNIVDIGAYELTFLSSPVSVNGRVTTLGGRGIYNARVTLTDANGTVVYARTNPFGYYRFLDLPPEMNYTITVSHKTYRFAPQRMVMLDGDRKDLNFIAQ